MERDLTDRVTVVTGAAAGIGLAMAEVFVRHGARLALVDRDPRVAETAEVNHSQPSLHRILPRSVTWSDASGLRQLQRSPPDDRLTSTPAVRGASKRC
jgi:NAD(P)-dependent dehydrogenase (short-subunit alcohol dehydrogenase family)